MEILSNFFSHFVQPDPKTALLVVINLIVIESLLSVDNAAVLASLVMGLPAPLRKRALRIGVVFAYIFRGLALVSAKLLIQISWLKLVAGGYLLYLFAEFFYKKITGSSGDDSESLTRKERKILWLNQFWSTVLMVEVMDLTFSIDNVFAAVAFTKNIYLVCTGVFIGIITMRIVAGYFVKLMERFPFLDTVAFIVIGILGLRLCTDFFCFYYPENPLCSYTHGGNAEFYFSIFTAAVFFTPILVSLAFGRAKK
ncbi:MAG TPA: DUF475 domain-containing protein [Chitinophagales bacterium]|nr:DUF475 domain-containing protein [Chitinophagales bacterium]